MLVDGVAANADVGDVVITLSALVSPVGVYTTGEIGLVRIAGWTTIPDNQDPNWNNVDDNQVPSWTNVDTAA